MRIVVPIKQVPETGAVKMDEETGTMIREGVEAIVNPLDLYAIELAVRLREDGGADEAEVVTLSMGPPKAEKAVREAVAMGCDRGVLVSDKAFAGSDTWATSYVLAAAIKKLGGTGGGTGVPKGQVSPVEKQIMAETAMPPDLIICGERATDGDTGQVGPGIAAFLDLPVITYVSKVRGIGDGKVVVERLVEDGHEVLEALLPVVITVVKEIGDPRLPTLRGKLAAKAADVPTWGPDDLDVEEDKLGLNGSPTRVVKIHKPTVARECQKIIAKDEESAAAAADRVVGFLKEKQLI